MSSALDDKQKKLVKSWYCKAQSSYEENDNYSAFISLWIAFNAYCYGKYSDEAVRPVANLENASKVVEGEIKGSVSVDANNSKTKITIQSIHSPATFSISIKKGYDEKRIYYEFAKKFESDHISLLENQISYQEAIQELKKSLQKGDRYYVIRMQRLSDYNQQQSVDELGTKGILVTLEDDKFKTIIDVLYQVRCNLFHGGKDPEVRNNDQIICAAYPVLEKIMSVIVRSLETEYEKKERD